MESSPPTPSSSSNPSFLSLVDPIKYIQKRKQWSPTTTTSSLLQAFSPLSTYTTNTTTNNGSTTSNTKTTKTTNSIPKGDNDGGTTIVDSLIQSTYIKPWLEYYQEVPRKIDLFPDLLTRNFEVMNHAISQKLDDLVRGNTQVLLLGAALGAAITAGVALGIGSVFLLFWNFHHGERKENMGEEEKDEGEYNDGDDNHYDDDNGGDDNHNDADSNNRIMKKRIHPWHHTPVEWLSSLGYYPSFLRKRQPRQHRQQRLRPTQPPMIVPKSFEILIGHGGKSHDSTRSTSDSGVSVSDGNSSNSSVSQIENSCRQCLDSITIQLGKKSLLWRHVLRITVYLVQEDNDKISCCDNHNDGGDDHDGSTRKIFQKILSEYPCDSEVVIHIVNVKSLENEQCMVQVEALVSCQHFGNQENIK